MPGCFSESCPGGSNSTARKPRLANACAGTWYAACCLPECPTGSTTEGNPRTVRDEDGGVHLSARERLEQDVLDPAVAGLVPADRPRVHRRPGVPERHGAECRADVVADRSPSSRQRPAARRRSRSRSWRCNRSTARATKWRVSSVRRRPAAEPERPARSGCRQQAQEFLLVPTCQRGSHQPVGHAFYRCQPLGQRSRHGNAAGLEHLERACAQCLRPALDASCCPALGAPFGAALLAVVAQERVAVRLRPLGCAQRPPPRDSAPRRSARTAPAHSVPRGCRPRSSRETPGSPPPGESRRPSAGGSSSRDATTPAGSAGAPPAPPPILRESPTTRTA